MLEADGAYMTSFEENVHNTVRISLLGGFRFSVNHEPLRTPGCVQRLVAYLALYAPATRAMAAGVLWPNVDERRAQASLRTCIWQLHRQCPGLLSSGGNDLALPKHVSIDLLDLEERAERILNEPGNVPIADLSAEPIGGELLPGWYEDWVLDQRERSRQLRLHALEAAAEELFNRNRIGPAVDTALKAISAEPLRESAHRLIIRIHLAEGNASEAVQHFLGYSHMLRHELGIAPSPLMQHLVSGWIPRRV
jgi:DNA-binding SARP family transcriptional activator